MHATAKLSYGLLKALGQRIDLDGTHLINSSYDIEINDMCSGVIEFAIVFASIMASYDVKIKKRLKGIFFGFILIFLLNPLRITLTFLSLERNMWFAEFLHDVLFRASLVIIVIVYYMLWYNMSVKR